MKLIILWKYILFPVKKKEKRKKFAFLQIKYFYKWKNSKCIIEDFINHIPSIPRYSWSKKITGALQEN